MLVFDGADNALLWPVHAVRDAAVLIAVGFLVVLVVLVILVVPLMVLLLLVMLVVLQATAVPAHMGTRQISAVARLEDQQPKVLRSCETGTCDDAQRRQYTAFSWQAGCSGDTCHVRTGSHACTIHQYGLMLSDRPKAGRLAVAQGGEPATAGPASLSVSCSHQATGCVTMVKHLKAV